jgi:ribosomal protein S18 acetylase RimI-like enzyme
MLAHATQSDQPMQGVRRFDVSRDIGPVSAVLSVGFAEELGPADHSVLREFRTLGYFAPVLWMLSRLSPEFEALLSGFVWVEGQEVVGTLTLTRLGDSPAHWLISNVAVLPQHRRRGIARQLMTAAVEHVEARNGQVITLQVRSNNTAAYELYASLGFSRLEQTTTLEREAARRPAITPRLPLRTWGPAESGKALDLARAVVPEAYQSMLPLRRRDYMVTEPSGWSDRVLEMARGYRVERLVVPDRDQFAASLTMKTQMRRGFHHVEISVRPGWRGRIERELVAHTLARLAERRPRPVLADVRSEELDAIVALQEAGFRVSHILDRLGLQIGHPRNRRPRPAP